MQLTSIPTANLLYLQSVTPNAQIQAELYSRHSKGDPLLVNLWGRMGDIFYGQVTSRSNGKKKPAAEILEARQAISDALMGKIFYSYACEAVLNTKWDFIDPMGLMQKNPAEVQDFLENCKWEMGFYAEMSSGRAKLLKMIFDCFLRWAKEA